MMRKGLFMIVMEKQDLRVQALLLQLKEQQTNTFDLFEAFFGGTSGGGAFGGMGGMGGMGGSMGGMGSSFGTRRRPTSVQGDDIR
jgi:uncharacterized membrane protein YgcG